MIRLWWHKYILDHEVIETRVSPPMWDVSARGVLLECSCRKVTVAR